MDYWIKIVFLFNLVICLQASKKVIPVEIGAQISDCQNTGDADNCCLRIFQESTQDLQRKIEGLHESQMRNEETITALRQENQQLSDKFDQSKKENKNLLSTVIDIKVVADASMNATEEIRQENKLLYESQHGLTILYNNLIRFLQSHTSSKAETYASVSTRVDNLEAKHSDVLSDLEQSREVNKNISDVISTLKDKNTELSSSIDDMKDHFHQLQSDLNDKHKDLLNSTNNIRSSMDELEALKQEHMKKIQKLTADLSKAFPCGVNDEKWIQNEALGSCYLLLEHKLTWYKARDKCRSLAGVGETSDLASIHSQEEQNFIAGLYDNSKNPWIGLNDIEREGRFQQWSDGSQVTYTNWKRGEPNQRGNEDCVFITKNKKWNDIGCGHKTQAVCKKQIQQSFSL